MSAPITEGHWNLVEKLCDLLDTEEMIGPSPADKAAQLIADSEARAIATQLEVVVILTRRWLNVEKERDQLRAEVERLKKQAVFDADHVHALNLGFATRAEVERSDALYQRACEVEQELRAEVKRMTHAYEYDHKCLYEVQDRCHLWKQRAEKAEAQLHALRLVCGTTDANKFETWTDRANARAERAEAELATERARLDHVLRNDWPFRDRKEIDAAMKEGVK